MVKCSVELLMQMTFWMGHTEVQLSNCKSKETERLNGFPAGWTDIEGIKPSRRGFLMGNALVVGIIENLREPIRKLIDTRS